METIRPFEVLIVATSENGLEVDSKILLNQIHSIDYRARVKKFLGRLKDELVKKMERGIKLVLALE